MALSLHRVSAEAAAQAFAGLGLDTGVDLARSVGGSRSRRRAHRRRAGCAARPAYRGARGPEQAAGRPRRCPRDAAARAGCRRPAGRGARRGRIAFVARSARRRSRRRSGRSSRRRPCSTCSAPTATRPRSTSCATSCSGRVRAHAGPRRSGAHPRGRAVRAGRPRASRSTSTRCARRRTGSRRARRSCCCSRSFGEEAEPLLQAIRQRSSGDESLAARRRRPRACRAHPRGRAHRPGDRRRRDHDRRGRHARQRAAHRRRARGRSPAGAPASPTTTPILPPRRRGRARREPDGRHLLPLACAGRGAVRRRGRRRSRPGQTLCILEAMKLMNEVKAEVEGIVRAIHAENGRAGRVRTAPVRARAGQRPAARRDQVVRCSHASSSRTGARSPSA